MSQTPKDGGPGQYEKQPLAHFGEPPLHGTGIVCPKLLFLERSLEFSRNRVGPLEPHLKSAGAVLCYLLSATLNSSVWPAVPSSSRLPKGDPICILEPPKH